MPRLVKETIFAQIVILFVGKRFTEEYPTQKPINEVINADTKARKMTKTPVKVRKVAPIASPRSSALSGVIA